MAAAAAGFLEKSFQTLSASSGGGGSSYGVAAGQKMEKNAQGWFFPLFFLRKKIPSNLKPRVINQRFSPPLVWRRARIESFLFSLIFFSFGKTRLCCCAVVVASGIRKGYRKDLIVFFLLFALSYGACWHWLQRQFFKKKIVGREEKWSWPKFDLTQSAFGGGEIAYVYAFFRSLQQQ